MAKSDHITVLIVDDIADTRENLRKLLYFERDIQVIGEAGHGEEGIQKARELSPDVILMDINLPGMDGITATEAIRSQMPDIQVIVMSVQSESEYLRRAMRAGAREFLIKPFGSEELAHSIRRVRELANDAAVAMTSTQQSLALQQGAETDRHCKVITVFSPKGGVGRTTVACNLAIALRSLTEKKVVLVDCSLQFGDVGVVLNIHGGKTIIDLVPHLGNLEVELLDSILSTHGSGIRVLLAPPRPEQAELVTADAIKRIIGKLRESYDYVVVDTWPTFQDTALAALDLSDRIILLFTMEMPAIKNVKLFMEVAEALDYPPDKMLLALNRADSTGGIQVSDLETSLRRPIPVRIVSDGRLATYALNRGVPFVVSNADSALAKGIFSLAQLVAGTSSTPATAPPGRNESGTKDGAGPLRRFMPAVKLGFGRRGGAAATS